MSGPEPSENLPWPKDRLPYETATGTIRAQLDDASFETDFADLAARFSAKSGGGLSPELSADLALEIVLNEIVEQACLATGATGAAIVLRRDGEMVCRATSGATAPELGARLDTSSGLTGECARTLRTQRCDDVLRDPHADIEASQRLGIRSVMVMPLARGAELQGIFEVFSQRPSAFSERDERTLEVLAGRILSNLDHARRQQMQPQAPAGADDASESAGLIEERDERVDGESAREDLSPAIAPPRRFDYITTALAVAVVVCTLLLGVLIARRFTARKATRAHPAPSVVNAANTAPVSPAEAAAKQDGGNAASPEGSTQTSSPAKSNTSPHLAPGELLVFENGKQVFRLPPAGGTSAPKAQQESGVERAASVEPDVEQEVGQNEVEQISPEAVEERLVHRVEPDYPEQARQQNIQGPVVLELHIAANGAVEDVQVVSGPPLLAQASTAAVKQWRFKPHTRNGVPAEMQTRVTLNFRLPP